MARRNQLSALRRVSCVITGAGALFMAAGGAAWCTVTRQLREERITVPGNAPVFAGKQVQDPATAYVQALVIKNNAERAAGGRSFADVSAALRQVEAGSEEESELRAHSSSLATAASLRTSLMTSVLAYGVSAFVAGLGFILTIVGTQFRRATRH